MKKFLNRLIPFILIGIAIVAFALGVMLLAYVFLFGALLGFILFGLSWIKEKFFSKKAIIPTQKSKSGRTIDSKDWREL